MTDVPASVRDTLFSPEKATFALVYSALEDAKAITGSRQRLPVVSAFGMVADGHHNLIGHRVHLQNALDFGDVVVTVGALGVFRQLLAARRSPACT